MIFKNKNILISQLQLANYGGSELLTLELVEYLSNQGANIMVVTSYIGPPIDKEFRKINNVKIFLVDDIELSTYLNENKIDIAWLQHQIIPDSILKMVNLKQDTIYVFNHMSPFYHVEFPNAWRVEQKMANAITFNAGGVRDAVLENGLLSGFDSELIFNLENPAPANFSKLDIQRSTVGVRNIVVISNHIPLEIKKAIDKLRKNGINVFCFGLEADITNSYKRITPSDFKWFDLVITIGKTVQYAMLAGLPVYCYDRFGGPGYLSGDNFELARFNNFSGRGFNRKTSIEIYKDIINNYDEAFDYAMILKNGVAKQFELGNKLDRLFKLINKSKRQSNDEIIDERDLLSYSNWIKVVSGYVNQQATLANELRIITYKNNKLQCQINELMTANEIINSELNKVKSSKSWRMTKPIRRVNNLLNDSKNNK